MFLVTTPPARPSSTSTPSSGRAVQQLLRHHFTRHPMDNRGEWETMSHRQIYPTPLLNDASSRHGGSLRLAGYIKLDHEVNDIQGCDFVTQPQTDLRLRRRFTNPLSEREAPAGDRPCPGRCVAPA